MSLRVYKTPNKFVKQSSIPLNNDIVSNTIIPGETEHKHENKHVTIIVNNYYVQEQVINNPYKEYTNNFVTQYKHNDFNRF